MGSSAPTPIEWLSGAATRLGIADPARFFGDELAVAFSAPFGDPGYAANALLPGTAPLELSFSEEIPRDLRFDFEPAKREPRSSATEALVRWVAQSFGSRAADELGARARALSDHATDADFDLFVGAVCDTGGLRELKAYYPLDRPSAPLVTAAQEELPALRELMNSVTVRRGGLLTERAYLVCTSDLELLSLEPLLGRFELGHRLPELVITLLRLTGDSFVLPPSSCVIGLRALGGSEVEVKIEILVGSIPPADDPAAIAALFTERPATQVAFERWLDAIALPRATLKASVVSARVTKNAPLSTNVYAHPVVDQHVTRAPNERELAPLLG